MQRAAAARLDEAPDDAVALEQALADRDGPRWTRWRLRLLGVAALLGCLALAVLLRTLAQSPGIPAQWGTAPHGGVVLEASAEPALKPYIGQRLVRLAAGTLVIDAPSGRLFAAPRWIVDDGERADQVRTRATLREMFDAGASLTLGFADGAQVVVAPRPPGLAGLGLAFWMLVLPVLLLYLVGAVVLLAEPGPRRALFAIITSAQALSLLWLALDLQHTVTPMPARVADDLPWRLALDLATAAAALQIFSQYPVRLPGRFGISATGWAVAALGVMLAWQGRMPGLWWWGQGLTFALGLASVALLMWAYRIESHPIAAVLQRFVLAALGTLAAVNLAVAAVGWQAPATHVVASTASLVWTLFFALLLVWVPFLSRARPMLREFALLAGLGTLATSLHLLFLSVFALQPYASLILAVLLAVASYVAARHWMLNQFAGSHLPSAERTFELLYRVARDVQKHPEREVALLTGLLRELFDPLEVQPLAHVTSNTRVAGDGSALVVPLPPGRRGQPPALALRFARRGRRIFTQEDARLTDRVLEQLRRAVAYDRAVEHGRSEERLRLAQDLHDDIGARLLTLMYKAQDPEMEEYLRHTLQDLKTLTRGLAATDHRLSHAAAEWKSDLQQRLAAAQVELGWSFLHDDDPELGVVQWSALTRVLRELVSNTIAHAHAQHVDIVGSLERGTLTLVVSDDGNGRSPGTWAHGLGLGGVRKRVKQLGGEVRWLENAPHGIVCEVRVPLLAVGD
ncbi:MAG: ATP-binding protein [Rubrivivax sp.]